MAEPTAGDLANLVKQHGVVIFGGMRFEWIGECQIHDDGTWSEITDA